MYEDIRLKIPLFIGNQTLRFLTFNKELELSPIGTGRPLGFELIKVFV
jgi:hypothetical protein